MSNEPTLIKVVALRPHPNNSRFEPRQEIVEQIATQLLANKAFDPAHF